MVTYLQHNIKILKAFFYMLSSILYYVVLSRDQNDYG